MRFAFIVLIFLLNFQYSFSQSEFLPRGQNGFSGGFGLSTSKDASGFNIFAGYSYQGFLDGKLMYSKIKGGKNKGGVLTPSITFYPLKQEDSERVPSLGISLGFCRYSTRETKTFTVPYPDTLIITSQTIQRVEESTFNAVLISFTAQKRTGYWRMFFFQPIVGAGVSIKKPWEFSIRCGVAIGTRIVRGPLIVLTPIIEKQSGITIFGLTIGCVM